LHYKNPETSEICQRRIDASTCVMTRRINFRGVEIFVLDFKKTVWMALIALASSAGIIAAEKTLDRTITVPNHIRISLENVAASLPAGGSAPIRGWHA
jgi:hypothetical protein